MHKGLMNVITEVKPCLHCGGKAKIDEVSRIGGQCEFMVYCTKCGIRTQYGPNMLDIIAVWNRGSQE